MHWSGYFLLVAASSAHTAACRDVQTAGALTTEEDKALAPVVSTPSAEAGLEAGNGGTRSQGAVRLASSTRGTVDPAFAPHTHPTYSLTCKSIVPSWGRLDPADSSDRACKSFVLSWVRRVESVMAEVNGWVTETLLAVNDGNFALEKLARKAAGLQPSKQEIADAGAGFLINDSALW